MNDTAFIHFVPYAAGTAPLLAQMTASPDWTVWVNAGMAGVVMVLLLKFFPMLLKHMEQMSQRHENTIKNIIEANTRKDEAWQELVQARGICPLKDEPKK